MVFDFPNNQLTVAAAGLGVAGFLYAATRSKQNLPPGPKGYPLIGSLLEWPSSQEWFTFTKWGEQYGDIVYLNVTGNNIVILNSPAAAKILLDERGATYSDRPHLNFANDFIGWKDSPIMCLASHRYFKPARKMMLSAVGSRSALDNYIGVEQHEAHRFLNRLIADPDNLFGHLRKLTGTVILNVIYGYDVKPGNDEYVNLIQDVVDDLNHACIPGAYMVDLIPALKWVPRWLPGAGWKTKADRMRTSLFEALTKPVDYVRTQLAAGTAQPSFVATELQRGEMTEDQKLLLGWTAEAMYTGGADTSISALSTFFLYMTLHPEALLKAQEEIDKVIGRDAFPTWADRERLPYVFALILETMRLGPVAPQAMPHLSTEDGVYDGYFIPKGTTIVPNVWGFCRDPNVYAYPNDFRPERFLGPTPETDPREFVFGFGRRVCPGRYLADMTVYTVISRALATLSIRKKIGSDGQPITPEVSYSGGAVVYPAKFDCEIKPRDKHAEDLIHTVHDVPYSQS